MIIVTILLQNRTAITTTMLQWLQTSGVYFFRDFPRLPLNTTNKTMPTNTAAKITTGEAIYPTNPEEDAITYFLFISLIISYPNYYSLLLAWLSTTQTLLVCCVWTMQHTKRHSLACRDVITTIAKFLGPKKFKLFKNSKQKQAEQQGGRAPFLR